MEFDFSSISPAAHTIALSAYIDFLPSLQYSKPLGTSRFLKTIQCLSPNGYVVVKLLVKPGEVEVSMRKYLDNLNEINKKLANVPNTVPFDTLIDSERATYIIRPYIRYNLYDRLLIRPFFENIEKKWIVYQLLVTLARMHELGVCHGDMKTENVLLTSWNWVLLSDIGLFKPVVLPDYNQTQFSFYFDTSQRHSCCIAPERFKTPDEIVNAKTDDVKLRPEFDIFSLGCVIAELYTDGIPLFSLPQMFKYRKGLYTPNLDAIEDLNIRKLIQSMIDLDPTKRLSAKQYLEKFRKTIFPDNFYTFLYSYMKTLAKPPLKLVSSSAFQACDYIIGRIHQDFDKISLYLGFKGKILETDELNASKVADLGKKSLIPVELNLPGMNRHIPEKTSHIINDLPSNDFGCLILLSIIFHSTRNTTHSSYRVKACDLILAFSEQLHDEAKLDRCLPYLTNMLDDPSENVQVAALCSITQLLLMVDTITTINAHIFAEYIIPKLQVFLKRSFINVDKDLISASGNLGLTDNEHSDSFEDVPGSYVRAVFASCLPHLAMCAKRFAGLSSLLTGKGDVFYDHNNGLKAPDFDEILELFEHLTVQILTDRDPYVRIALMKNIQPLCVFFGKDKTNDVILSHVITYLNDKDVQLKLNFISSIVPLSIFVGMTSLEQYILPLLLQALYGPEDIIVISLLKVFSELVALGLIRNRCFIDLIRVPVVLLLHPNGLIRNSVITLILSMGNQLHIADFYCTLYPLIRPFLGHEVTDFTWENILLACHSPISFSVYNDLKLWSLSNEESLFWQRISPPSSQRTDYFGNSKIAFLKKKDSMVVNSSFNNSQSNFDDSISDIVSNSEVPLSNSDKKHIYKLKQLGFEEKDLWKIATLRHYVYKYARLDSMAMKNRREITRSVIIPRSVTVEVSHKQVEDKEASVLMTTENFKDGNKLGSKKKDSFSPLVLKNLGTALPVVGTSDNSLASSGMDINANITSENSNLFGDLGQANIYDQRLNMKNIKTIAEFSYLGKNSSILQFLRNLKFEPSIDDYYEFGEVVENSPQSSVFSTSPSTLGSTLVSKLFEHKSPLLDIIVSPDQTYFLSADCSGVVKIWDFEKLKIDVTGSSSLSVDLGEPITSIAMMKNRQCFSVAKLSGAIDIYRVDHSHFSRFDQTQGKNSTISLLRRWRLESGEHATDLQFCDRNSGSTIFVLTSDYKFIAFDIRTMAKVYEIKLNVHYGVSTSFVISSDGKWAVVGTNKGVLNLLDLDAQICLKSTKFKHGSHPIRNMQEITEKICQDEEKRPLISFIGGTEEDSVVVWDVSRAHPRVIIYSKDNETHIDAVQFTVEDVNSSSKFYSDAKTEGQITYPNRYTALSFVPKSVNHAPHILTVNAKKVITNWNLQNFAASYKVLDKFSDNPVSFVETKINSHLSIVHGKYVQKGETKADCFQHPEIPTDIVTCMQHVDLSTPLLLCGDRQGHIHVYK